MLKLKLSTSERCSNVNLGSGIVNAGFGIVNAGSGVVTSGGSGVKSSGSSRDFFLGTLNPWNSLEVLYLAKNQFN